MKWLTWLKRDFFELFHPLFRDLNCLQLLFFILGNISCHLGVSNDLLELIWFQCVEHIEEIGAINLPAFSHAVWEVHHEPLVRREHLLHVLDVNLLIERDVDWDNISHLHELFLVSEDVSKEVLGDIPYGRQIVLHYNMRMKGLFWLTIVREVYVEVFLRPESTREFVVLYVDYFALLLFHHRFKFKSNYNSNVPYFNWLSNSVKLNWIKFDQVSYRKYGTNDYIIWFSDWTSILSNFLEN